MVVLANPQLRRLLVPHSSWEPGSSSCKTSSRMKCIGYMSKGGTTPLKSLKTGPTPPCCLARLLWPHQVEIATLCDTLLLVYMYGKMRLRARTRLRLRSHVRACARNLSRFGHVQARGSTHVSQHLLFRFTAVSACCCVGSQHCTCL